jgi:hypothetical protein
VSGGLAFKLRRLRSMSPAEVRWRVEERISLAMLARRAGRPVPALPIPAGGVLEAFRASSAPLDPAAGGSREEWARAFEARFPGETARLVAQAEAVLAGRIALFARTFEFGPDPRAWPWNRSPDGGPAILLSFGPLLDYRDPARVGDARLSWELGRHQWLAPVAQAAYLTGEPRFARFAFTALEAWLEACPPYRGIQWVSALEYALRSFSWGWALALTARTPAGAAVEAARWERLLAAWAEQLRFIAAHDSRYSSANNHRLGEGAGLAWGGHLLGFLDEAAAWRERGHAILEECVLAQTTEGGVTREHAFAYQHFVLDFAVAVGALAARAGRPQPAALRERTARIAAALERLSPGGREPWPVGDGDEGRVLDLAERFEERLAASLECAARLTGDGRAAGAGTGAGAGAGAGPARYPRVVWLGLEAAVAPRTGADAAAGPGVETGGYVVRSWCCAQGEARLLFDAAPLGLPPLFAHGHADALMLLLDAGGPRLVDPGTGAYHAQPGLRERLRGTAAHNTVGLDGLDQSVRGGLFQWLRAARITAPATVDAAGVVEAAHDGYARLAAPRLHRRAWFVREPDLLLVADRIEPAAGGAGTGDAGTGGTAVGAGVAHHAVARWHVGDGVARDLAARPGHVEVTWPDGLVGTIAGFGPAGACARAAEPGVWSPRFRETRPCGKVEVGAQAAAPLLLVSAIALGPLELECRRDDGGLRVEARTPHGTLVAQVAAAAPGRLLGILEDAASGASSQR